MKIRIPLQPYFVDGKAAPRPLVLLRVRSHYGDYARIPCYLDTGADVTSIPISLAEQDGIPFQRTIEVPTVGLVGRTTSFRHTVHVAIGNREYDWPCNFINTPPGARSRTAVLGRAGFLSVFNVSIVGEHVILTRRGSFADRWERLLSLLGRPFVRQCSFNEPL
jgi:hypothetical protein